MSTYALGDIQGCYDTLQRLLQRIRFDPGHDTVWLVGDLVNRGPRSLDVLRWVKNLGERAITVLGNHDLHLLAVSAGLRTLKPDDTLQDVLQAPDRDDLLAWLRSQPLLVAHGEYVMVHAGLLPQWTVADARSIADAAHTALRGPAWRAVLQSFYEAEGKQWQTTTSDPLQQLGVALQAFTRLRVCSRDGRMDYAYNGPPDGCPAGTLPWFAVPERRSHDATIIFGHWAALGLHMTPRLLGLDTGCVWGRMLTAVRLEDRRVFQESACE